MILQVAASWGQDPPKKMLCWSFHLSKPEKIPPFEEKMPQVKLGSSQPPKFLGLRKIHQQQKKTFETQKIHRVSSFTKQSTNVQIMEIISNTIKSLT